jgi:tetratricopeptide (TPR) repeat protein
MRESDINRIKGSEVWENGELSLEDADLNRRIDEFFKAEIDIREVKSDPGYGETDKTVKLMISDNQNNKRNGEIEKFVREGFSYKTQEVRINDEIREIKEEIRHSSLDEISSEWVKEWHEKKQGDGAKKEEIREFVTSSLEKGGNISGQQSDHRKKTGLRRSLVIKYILLTAAIMVGAIFLVDVLMPSDDPVRIFEKYYQSIPAVSPVTRDANGNTTNTWASSAGSYNNGDYKAALAGFSELVAKDTSQVPPRFFLGMTYIALGYNAQATRLLEEVAGRKGEYSKEARWYLGLIYLKEGNKDKATENFELLAQSSGYYSERSGKILRRLR